MRVEWKVVAGVAAILLPWTVLYWVFSYEPAGTAALVVAVVALVFLALYLLVQGRQTGLRPEDRPDATVEASAADLGLFPAASIWPITVAAGATTIGFGLTFSRWIALPGVALLVFALAGFAVEAHRDSTD
jgi:hypothetical protein